MKKNITINLCGRLYSIDEDAFELLSHYTDTLRSYFSRQEGGDEIANDIEARISELFDELKAQGIEAITIEHVQDIIKRIGELNEITNNEESVNDTANNTKADNGTGKSASSNTFEQSLDSWFYSLKKKRFYRDPSRKILGGVMAGCASYFGGVPLAWRLAYIVLTLLWWNLISIMSSFIPFIFQLTPILFYIILVILAPQAKTPEQKLRMKGIDVTPQNLSNEVAELSISENEDNLDKQGMARSFFNTLGSIIAWIGAVFGLLMFIPFIVTFCLTIAFASQPEAVLQMFNAEEFIQHTGVMWCLWISILATCFIPAYSALHFILNQIGKVQSMGYIQRIIMCALCVLAIAGITSASICMANIHKEKQQEEYERYKLEHTHGGIEYSDEDWEYMQEEGWQLVKSKNCNEHFTYSGQYLNDDHDYRYLDSYNSRGGMEYTAQKGEQVKAGTYRLSALGRSDEASAYIFVTIGNDSTIIKDIPCCGNKEGNIWDAITGKHEVTDSLVIQYVNTLDEETRNNIADAHFQEGYGWSLVTIDQIVIPADTTIYYGVTTDPKITGHKSKTRWFSACDFKLEKIQ